MYRTLLLLCMVFARWLNGTVPRSRDRTCLAPLRIFTSRLARGTNGTDRGYFTCRLVLSDCGKVSDGCRRLLRN